MATNVSLQELIAKILLLEGLTSEEKSSLIELLRRQKKFGIVWEDKPEDVEERLREELPILKEVQERALICPEEGAPDHLIIEGDNLEALTTLSYTHAGKVDVIYIDPPYNTGKKEEFKYNDHYVDAEDQYKHSKWISFMSRRLRIAKSLLSEKGVLFISIDNNEFAQLKILCDEIFGEQNFVETFIWNKTSTPPALSYKSRKTHEFILCYVNRQNSDRFVGLINEGGDAPLLNEANKVVELSFPAGKVEARLQDGTYKAGDKGRVLLLNDVEVRDGRIVTPFSLRGRFRWQQSTLDREIAEDCLLVVKSDKFAIRYCRKGDRTVAPPNFLAERFYGCDTTIDKTSQGVDTNERAGKELTDIIGPNQFGFPKPTSLISYLLSFNNKRDSIVLDFFAGSGTTMHATMLQNMKDGGSRQCILITNNENRICEKVTYERNKRVIEGYTTPKGEEVAGLNKNTLRYYRTDFVGREPSAKNKRALVAAATDMLCIKNGIYKEANHFGGLRLKPAIARYFEQGNKRMLIIYNEESIPYFAEELNRLQVKEKVLVYVFAPGNYPFTDEFDSVKEKVELCALPAAIYNAYQKVLPKRRRVQTENMPNGANEKQE